MLSEAKDAAFVTQSRSVKTRSKGLLRLRLPYLSGPSVPLQLSTWPSVLPNRSSTRLRAAQIRLPPALLLPFGLVPTDCPLVLLPVPAPCRSSAAPAEFSALSPTSPTLLSGGREGASRPSKGCRKEDTRGRRPGQVLSR